VPGAVPAAGVAPLYNPTMLNFNPADWAQPLAGAAVARLTLLINHVLASESVATQRLQPHAGRTLSVELRGWPSLLPAWPPLVFRITPAGLMEWLGDGVDAPGAAAADLRLSLDASNPALLMLESIAASFGQPRPRMEVAGDSALAADVSWLAENLRWDIEDDLAQVIGEAPARQVASFGEALAQGLKAAAEQFAAMAAKMRSPS
jgi:ubiquinone biosynthesis protein UbiJ